MSRLSFYIQKSKPDTGQALYRQPEQSRRYYRHGSAETARRAGGQAVQNGVEQQFAEQKHRTAQDAGTTGLQPGGNLAGAQREKAKVHR